MGVLVVGSVALDSIQTPFSERKDLLGGSATYFSFSAGFFTKVALVTTVGEDFPKRYISLFQKNKNIDIEGLKIESGRTFKWGCRYEYDLNAAHTIYTHLNVFKNFLPQIPPSFRDKKYIFLANIDPDLQESVLNQVNNPKLVVCDTMNYWIENKKRSLLDLLKAVDVFLLNDSEIRQLTKEPNLIKAIHWTLKKGPKMVVVKKGEHGSILATKRSLFSIPAYPLKTVYDPTGAGDTFAGGFLGYLSECDKISDKSLRRAVAYGSVMASFAVEGFGPQQLLKLTKPKIESRYKKFQKLVKF